MPKVVITAQVENTAAWEKVFRTHGDLFRSQSATSPYWFGIGENNEVAVCADVEDVETYLEDLQSKETADAMAKDGVKRDSVKVFVLDKKLDF